ncbi:MAG: T9SS type A sorting domain-containing protein, partial [Fidelibacterota bacterium]
VEKFVSTDLSQQYYGVDPLTTGSIIVTGEVDVPVEFLLSPAYPNPFNPVTTISYHLPEASSVKVEVFDMTGQLITTLESKDSEPGYYSVNWNAGNQPSGIYFIKLTAGRFSDIQKIMLVK